MRSLGWLCALGLLAGSAPADVIYDAGGFETFADGDLDGQDGWYAGWFAPDPFVGTNPFIQDFGPALGGRSVVIEGGVGASFFGREFATTHPEPGFSTLQIEFDIWRFPTETPPSNLQWFGFSDPNSGFGGQVHSESPIPGAPAEAWTYPFGPGPDDDYPRAPTIFGRWTNVTLRWDAGSGQARAWYDGAYLGSVPINGVTLESWDFSLSGETAHACIDNFVVSQFVPEPGGLLLLAATGGLLLRSSRAGTRRSSSSNPNRSQTDA